MRTGQQCFERGADTEFETAVLGTGVIEREQSLEVVRRQRTTIRLGTQPRHDLFGARARLRRRQRAAAENATAARRIRHTGWVERAGDGEHLHVRLRGDTSLRADLRVGNAMADRCDVVIHRTFEGADERGRDALRTGPHRNWLGADFHAVRVGLRHTTVHLEHGHALAIHRDLNLLVERRGGPEQLARGNRMQRDREHIFAISGKRVRHRRATARAGRCAFHRIDLRRQARNLVARRTHARLRITHRQAADFAGRVEVGIEERGRRHLHVGDVVEVGALGIERQP